MNGSAVVLGGALVLGANGLIGNAICRLLGADGLTLIPAGRDTAALERLADDLRAAGIRCPEVLTVDATDDDAVEHAVARAAGIADLTVAVNNIGRGHRPSPLTAMAFDEFDAVVAVTFRAVAVALRAELRAMTEVDGPRAIVNVASSAGTSGAPGMSAYAAAKHAVIGLTRTAAIDEARHGIRVNAVAPGPIESGPIMAQDAAVREQVGQYMPMGRMGRADEVAEAVRWMASPASSYVTGTVLAVDGGKAA
ncbi:SDR family NAD(P)-dependent oxidoreductase [Leifsonia poae]|uniref:Oxidoreductase n=1 Tax=Leifsonia poae TaxID=110933 RepID=A0A9W6H709_9MICO|nr:SDR family NAD(P)-dependent oxidoreductase [Leifsonia poae]GLJ75110.1 oxidoreductase [Leifsonia poae]